MMIRDLTPHSASFERQSFAVREPLSLIDLDYEPWHTLDDTPERCSARSLTLATRRLVELVRGISIE